LSSQRLIILQLLAQCPIPIVFRRAGAADVRTRA
jgi:hypothetical protein